MGSDLRWDGTVFDLDDLPSGTTPVPPLRERSHKMKTVKDSPTVAQSGSRRRRRDARRRALAASRWRFCGERRARSHQGDLRFIALTDASPLIIAKEKGFSPNTACPMSR